MEAKWHVLKQRMGQQLDQGRNQKIPWNKWKWGHNNPESWDTGKAILKGKFIALQAYLKKKKKKSSNKQPNFTLKGTWKRKTNKAQSE